MEAVTEDISGGGMMFGSEKFISPSRTVEIELYKPIITKERTIVSILLEARIIWVKKIETSDYGEECNRFMVGAKFINIRKQDRHCIMDYLIRRKSNNR
jgi:c-di-GMP-binding flagellar brake protein YcgR